MLSEKIHSLAGKCAGFPAARRRACSVALGVGAAADTRASDPTAAASVVTTKTRTQYTADADIQAVLDELALLGGKPIETLTPAQARQQPTPADAVMSLLRKRGEDTSPAALVPAVTSVDRQISGAASKLAARLYTPAGAGPFPVVVYFHGGGWVIGDKQVYDGSARGLSKQAQAIVLSVDYRLAPETKFPAAWDDALAAYTWVATNAASIDGDPKRLALAGESASGNLAVATAVAARDAGVQAPKRVLAVYPVGQTGSLATASYQDSETAKPLNKAMIEWFIDKLLTEPEQKADPRLEIFHAKLTGLAPMTIIGAQIGSLREYGALLEAALKKAGVSVQRRIYTGVTHEFFGMAAAVKRSERAQQEGGQALQASLAGASDTR